MTEVTSVAEMIVLRVAREITVAAAMTSKVLAVTTKRNAASLQLFLRPSGHALVFFFSPPSGVGVARFLS